MFNVKRGQAAMEFLMTYGWAILAAIVAIGVLAYFGVFNPGSITGNVILVSPPFHTISSQVVMTPSSTNFELANKGGANTILTSITVTGTSSSLGINCLNDTTMSIAADEIKVISVPCTGPLQTGEKFAGDITILYTISGLSITQRADGTIQTTIQ